MSEDGKQRLDEGYQAVVHPEGIKGYQGKLTGKPLDPDNPPNVGSAVTPVSNASPNTNSGQGEGGGSSVS